MDIQKFKQGFLKSAIAKGYTEAQALEIYNKDLEKYADNSNIKDIKRYSYSDGYDSYDVPLTSNFVKKHKFKDNNINVGFDHSGNIVGTGMDHALYELSNKPTKSTLPETLISGGVGSALGTGLSGALSKGHGTWKERLLTALPSALLGGSVGGLLGNEIGNAIRNGDKDSAKYEIHDAMRKAYFRNYVDRGMMDKKAADQYTPEDYQQIKQLLASKGYNPQYNIDDTHPYAREYNQKLMQLRDSNFNANPEIQGLKSGVGHAALGGLGGYGLGHVAGEFTKRFANPSIAKHLPRWGRAVGAAVGALGSGLSGYHNAKAQTSAVKKLTNPTALRQTFDQLSAERQYGNNQIGQYRAL